MAFDNNPANNTDPKGEDVRLETGNDSDNWFNDNLHQYISVDVYNDQGNVIGERTYSYGYTGGFPAIGHVYVDHSDDPNDLSYGFHDGTLEDLIFLNQENTQSVRDVLDYMVGQGGPYYLLWKNCRTFSSQTMEGIRESLGK